VKEGSNRLISIKDLEKSLGIMHWYTEFRRRHDTAKTSLTTTSLVNHVNINQVKKLILENGLVNVGNVEAIIHEHFNFQKASVRYMNHVVHRLIGRY
jgi:hypothetical protein